MALLVGGMSTFPQYVITILYWSLNVMVSREIILKPIVPGKLDYLGGTLFYCAKRRFDLDI